MAIVLTDLFKYSIDVMYLLIMYHLYHLYFNVNEIEDIDSIANDYNSNFIQNVLH